MTEIAATPDRFNDSFDEQAHVQAAIAELIALERPVTAAEFEALPEGPPYPEHIDGELIVNPPPLYIHQNILTNLLVALVHAAPPPIKVLAAPTGWRIEHTDHVQPDIVVIGAPPTDPRYLDDPPRLCVEILSPSDRRQDLVRKRVLYEDAGMPSYWLVDPAAGDVPNLIALDLVDGRYEERHNGTAPYRADLPFPITIDPSALVR